MSRFHPNEFWNDSCWPDELRRALSQGATGATSNPPLMWKAIQQGDAADWRRVLDDGRPATAEAAAWTLMRHLAVVCAQALQPLWDQSQGKMGLLSVQVDPRRHADPDFMVNQAVEINRLAPNLSIKIPVTQAGLTAIEELAARGVTTTATVSFTVPQVVRVAETFRRGLVRARAGHANRPVQCFAVLMAGRLDDHLRDVAKEKGLDVGEKALTSAGVAVVKKASRLFRDRGYESRLLVGAMRGPYHITEFMGADIVLTTPLNLHEVFAGAGGRFPARIDEPVSSDIVQELSDKLPDFVRAYEEDGMAPDEFAGFGSTAKTLSQFVRAFEDTTAFAGSLI
ncbi:MAG: transaldolase [Planctomycetes bacterium]|nr:transaldolase [Planctomycetota bacterium]